MSVNFTTTTTTTTTYSSDQDALSPGAGNLPGNTFGPESSDILLNNGSAGNTSNALNNLPIPDSLKDVLLGMMGMGGHRLPSDSSAAQTIQGFQKENKTGLLSAGQMKDIADTGYYKDKDGSLKPVSSEVQAAAQAMMANGGALFKRLESANNGKHDGLLGSQDFPAAIRQGVISANPNNAGVRPRGGLSNDGFLQAVMQQLLSPTRPSEYNTGKTIDSFMKDNKIDLLSANDMRNIADTGYCKDKNGDLKPVSPQVQAAAQALMANGGELFKKLEAAYTGKQDGLLGQKDFGAAVGNGSLAPAGNSGTLNYPTIAASNNVLPSAYSAGDTADRFMKDNHVGLLSASDMKSIADTGYYRDKDGQLKAVSPDMQAAAQALMANGGRLFKQLEAANTGKQDGLLGQADFAAAVKNGALNAGPTLALPNNVLPSAYSAGNTVDRFMKDNHADLLSAGDMKSIADTGYFKDKDGQLKAVSPDMQAAAQALMANGGQLFKQLEAAYTGKQDGLLGQKDFAAAVKNGSLNLGAATPTLALPNNVLPSANSAGNTIDHFLKDNKIDLLSASDMKSIADTGYYQDKNGDLKPVSPQVQAAAQALTANGGELFKKLEAANTGKQDGLLGQKDFAAAVKNGSLNTSSAGTPTDYPTIVSSNNVLPSAYSAGDTIDRFLKDNKIDLQSASDVKGIADTGYYKDKNGDLKPVTPEVQAAAQALMANGGQLFKQLEAANTGKQDGLLGQADFAAALKNGGLNAGAGAPTLALPNNVLPSAHSAGDTVDRFMKDKHVDLLSAGDVKSIADTGYYKDKDGQLQAVSPQVQAAAQALMANGGELFKQLEAANTGKQDGLLGQKDFAAAVKNGGLNAAVATPTVAWPNHVLPSVMSAGRTVDHFMKDNKIDLLSASDVKSIADTGYCQDSNGDLKPVSPKVQAAAQALMANDGQLFKQLEAAHTGEQDGLLGRKDFGAMLRARLFPA